MKSVTSSELEELPEYDLTGPEYVGITEMVSDSDYANADTTDDTITVCISPYHTQGGNSDLQTYVVKSPNSNDTVWNALKDLNFTTKCGYDSIERLDDLLDYYYEIQTTGISSGSTLTQQDLDAIKLKIGRSTSSGLRGSGDVTSGHSHQTTAYPLETDIITTIQSVLTSANSGLIHNLASVKYNVIVTDSSKNTGLSMKAKSTEAASEGATVHVVIWSRKNSSDQGTGWYVIYNDGNDVATQSKELAKELFSAMSGCTISAVYDSEVATSSLGTSEYYTVLNWATIPTVILVVGSYADEDTKGLLSNSTIQKQIAKAINTAMFKIYANGGE